MVIKLNVSRSNIQGGPKSKPFIHEIATIMANNQKWLLKL